MTTYSVAEAKNRLPALIAAAARGEAVTITRYGKPVAELKPAQPAVRKPWTPEEQAAFWDKVDAIGIPPMPEDSGALLRKMRDEEEGY